MSERVYLTHIHIRDLGGIPEFEANLGQFCIVSGANGAGKTTVLNCIGTFFEGGSAPDMVRQGCESGEVTLTFSDGYTAWKQIRADGYEVKVKTPEGGVVKRVAEWLKERAAGLGFDPIALLSCPPEKRAEFLLARLPISFTPEEVNEAVGREVLRPGGASVALPRFTEIRDGVYEGRAEVNRKDKAIEGTIATLRGTLPKESDDNWAVKCDECQARITEIEGKIASAASEVALAAEQARNEIADVARQKKAAILVEIEALLAQVAQRNQSIKDLDTALESDTKGIDAEAAAKLAEMTAELQEQKTDAQIELSTAKAHAEAETRAAGTREVIEQHSKEKKVLVAQERQHTEALNRLDALHHSKLREVALEGLDLKIPKKGAPIITINGIRLENLNRAQQIVVAIQLLAAVKGGTLPLLLVEGAELDNDHMQELIGPATEFGFQVVMARWEDGAGLAIKSLEVATA